MAIEDAIQNLQARIHAVSPQAELKVVRMSAEEARIQVYAGATDLGQIRTATFQPVLDYLNKEGWDIQVLTYDKDHPPEV
jgi:predicted lipid-binding transport protein (Tim44 family)